MKKKIICGIFLSIGIFSFGQTTKDKKIEDLMATMGTMESMKTTFEYMIKYYQDNNPEISVEYWERARKMVDYQDLIYKMAPVYSKHFTEQEIDDLLHFYQSDTGKKMIDKMPAILQESMEIGQRWGAEMAKKIEENIRAAANSEQYTPPPAPMRSK